MANLNISMMDFVKLIVFAVMTALGFSANNSVGNVAKSADMMQAEMAALKDQMHVVNGTLIKFATNQANMIKALDDHETRIRIIEKQD